MYDFKPVMPHMAEPLESRILFSALAPGVATDLAALTNAGGRVNTGLKAALRTLAADLNGVKKALAPSPTAAQKQLLGSLQKDERAAAATYRQTVVTLLSSGTHEQTNLEKELKNLAAQSDNAGDQDAVQAALGALQNVFSDQAVTAAENTASATFMSLDSDLNAIASAAQGTGAAASASAAVNTFEEHLTADLATLSMQLSATMNSIATLAADVAPQLVPVLVYPLHNNITATEFWVGEPADSSNDDISNTQSAWDGQWEQHFGGMDDPANRNGWLPAAFTPMENPFYFALPYDDFNNNGDRSANALQVIPWAAGTPTGPLISLCKNRWIEIISGNTVAYAQWEDVGPFGQADSAYVFGSARPTSAINDHAGLDLSPAATDYLSLNGEQAVSWRFVAASQIPPGPWTQIITTSQVDWT